MDEVTNRRGYAIGVMSRETGVNIETIRYYERIGIMPKPDRTEGGNRQYNHDQLKRLFFIKRCRELDFSIEEIRSLLRMTDSQEFTCGEVHTMTVDHLATVKKKVADLRRLEKALQSMAAECGKGDVPDCPIIDILFSV
ncbi:helix-turn-helix domain-containing protein [Sneathiella sp.]|uniref:MerR family transcriptional regulator n=1 Tax=Sneathiella sp. TaxID=1964365 RepID=UPI003562B453